MFAIPNAAKRSKVVAAWMKAEGLTAGVFDVFLPWPANGYHGLFIEMKRHPNKPTSSQVEFGTAMSRRGYQSIICYTSTDAISAIVHYLGLPGSCRV